MNDKINDDSVNKHSWFTPELWLVIGIPVMSLFVGLSLVAVAVKSGSPDMVIDNVQRISRIQLSDMTPDVVARQRNLNIVVRLDGDTIIATPVGGDIPHGLPLQLRLVHPIAAEQDLTFELRPSARGWETQADIPDTHDWIVQIAPQDEQWRLRGRLGKHEHAIQLMPVAASTQ